jgi:hypothetical protein
MSKLLKAFIHQRRKHSLTIPEGEGVFILKLVKKNKLKKNSEKDYSHPFSD